MALSISRSGTHIILSCNPSRTDGSSPRAAISDTPRTRDHGSSKNPGAKAEGVRQPALVKVIGAEYMRLRGSTPLFVEELGIVDCGELERAVHDAEQGRDVATVSLLRILALEDWLRNLRSRQSQSRERLFPKDCVIPVVRCSDQELLGREN